MLCAGTHGASTLRCLPTAAAAVSPLPSTPDGRYWKAGVAQGVSANPYEKRLVTSARRKPIVVRGFGSWRAAGCRAAAHVGAGVLREMSARAGSALCVSLLPLVTLPSLLHAFMQVGPRSIAVIVDGESHTLGGVITDVAWLQ